MFNAQVESEAVGAQTGGFGRAVVRSLRRSQARGVRNSFCEVLPMLSELSSNDAMCVHS